MIENILNISEMILAVLLVIAILLQAQGTGLGAVFGGEGNVYRTKRGAEKRIFQATVVLSILFFGVALANVLYEEPLILPVSDSNAFLTFLKTLRKKLFRTSSDDARGELRAKNLTRKHVLSVSKQQTFPSLRQWKQLPRVLDIQEKKILFISLSICFLSVVFLVGGYVVTHRVEVPTVGGEYTEGLVGTPQFINPLYSSSSDVDADITSLVYSGLMTWDQDDGLILDLADSLEISEDHRTYTFHIRDDAKWHNGDSIRASDVVFTINSIQNTSYRSPHAVSFAGIYVAELDEKTVQFVLEEAFAPFLPTLTVGILPARLWQQIPAKNAPLASLNLEPVGSGPYRFEKFSIDKNGNIRSYTLTRNKDYYGNVPLVETVTFKFYANAQAAINALKNKNVEGISFIPSDLVGEIEEEKLVTILRPSIPRTTILYFNLEASPILEDSDIRRAIALSVNKQEILDEVLNGFGNIIYGPILEGSIGYHAEIEKLEENLDEANALLDETNYTWAEGAAYRSVDTDDDEEEVNELSFVITTVNQGEFINTAEKISSQLARVGIRVDIDVVPSESFYDSTMKNRNYEALLTAIQLGIDPDPYPFWHSSQISAPGLNLARYTNRNADTLLEEARLTTDEGERALKYQEFQDILMEDMPAIFLYQSTYTYAIATKIQDVSIDRLYTPSDRFTNIADWYIKTKKAIR